MDFEEKTRVYLDTSVISHLDHPDAGEKHEITHRFWEEAKTGRYDIFISETVLREINRCDEEKRKKLLGYLEQLSFSTTVETPEIAQLGADIIRGGLLPPKSVADSLHIAAALDSECDYLLSWNMKHLTRVKTNNGIRLLTAGARRKPIEIITPQQLNEILKGV
jgi:predicted nucleic acid-binding protein